MATLLNLLLAGLARVLLHVPGEFTPLASGPVSFLTLAAGAAGVGVFAALVLFTATPLRWFRVVAIAVALLSTASPLGLLVDRSRVPSTSGRAVLAAALLHLVTAAVLLWRLGRHAGVADAQRATP